MYKVIRFFTDLQDNGHAYNVGDIYPRKGATATLERIAVLSGKSNRQGVPLIQVSAEVKKDIDKGLDSAITPVQPEKAGQEAPLMNDPQVEEVKEVRKSRKGRRKDEK